MLLFIEQTLNGLQLGIFLFLVAAGLTLIFGIMGVINLAHGSLFMIGAYVAATVTRMTGSFALGLLAALPATALAGILIEVIVIRRLYPRDHLDQVLATFGLILFINEAVTMVWGRTPLFLNVPPALSGSIEIIPGVPYPVYRIAIIVAGVLVALLMWLIIARTRIGMLIRAGSTNREMVGALGVDIALLYTALFAAGAVFAGFAGAMAGPLVSVQVGMGEQILILAFVVIVIGGIGSIRGALVGAVLVGVVDTLGRAFVPDMLKLFMPPAEADGVGAGLASMMVYLLMAVVLVMRPSGLFPVAVR
ncbi:amino acid/amide ABC transporter membrane protein 1 (HAAT family) [Tepidamorphus gemmatus]|jgi:branched-chain amino acid transport system permease protein|uniref:Amino acid/amide ABC transporter membrane protein 1 (HAAT family) n=1 Tax=Tepidamorphus gemmatus TaxID=747076 RepID=A0A4R3MFQ2_9HYPH|nr:branched-chain amino acid ABC transporter permease [Tepidamorphus gemmatus]TCT12555.1 amino acid/amide ABC transporter membrane protein 1 (HAAT family) [Tepidamorphus gemmatus]